MPVVEYPLCKDPKDIDLKYYVSRQTNVDTLLDC